MYVNKTVIPDYLRPLPNIPYEVYRKYRPGFATPPSLLDLCCNALNRGDYHRWIEEVGNPNGDQLQQILTSGSRVITNSASTLCRLKHPSAVALFLLRRAKHNRVYICTILRTMRIIMDETSFDRRHQEVLNHWDRIPAFRPWCPSVKIGRPNLANATLSQLQ